MFTFLLIVCCYPAWVQQPVAIGNKAPDCITQTIYGDTVNIQSYRGYIVLVDFWASWNVPSRKHNLSTKKIYEKYRAMSLRKKRKFIVVQISLDTRQDLLTTAISKDNLYWRNHICDYKGWKSPYIDMFSVKRLPTNFLIDTSGVIVAKDIWENQLDDKLLQLMQ